MVAPWYLFGSKSRNITRVYSWFEVGKQERKSNQFIVQFFGFSSQSNKSLKDTLNDRSMGRIDHKLHVLRILLAVYILTPIYNKSNSYGSPIIFSLTASIFLCTMQTV